MGWGNLHETFCQSKRPPLLGFSERRPFHPPSLPLSPKPPKTLSGPVSSSPATKSIAAASAGMLLPLRRLSGHLSRAVAVSASADVLLPLRRLPGHLRRSLSTAAANPPWAMIYRLSETPTYTRVASFSLAPPPSATLSPSPSGRTT
ncbi:hypothetical protein ACQJBY_016320 [Aegilops geniculata]